MTVFLTKPNKEDKTVASPSKIKTLSPYKILRKLSTKKKRKATMPDEMSHLNRRFMNDDNIEGKKNSIISLVSAREINDDNSNERLKWRRRRRFNDEDVEIECQILAKCFAQKKKHESGILGNPWNIVAKYNKEKKEI